MEIVEKTLKEFGVTSVKDLQIDTTTTVGSADSKIALSNAWDKHFRYVLRTKDRKHERGLEQSEFSLFRAAGVHVSDGVH